MSNIHNTKSNKNAHNTQTATDADKQPKAMSTNRLNHNATSDNSINKTNNATYEVRYRVIKCPSPLDTYDFAFVQRNNSTC